MNQVKIFDTTLRDGEQSPGCSMNLREKIEIAKCLERMKVDIIEAGFAISSPGDFESVQSIAREIKGCTIASLARSTEGDIDAAWNAVKEAADPRIHLFIATSPLHMEYKLKMKPEDVLETAGRMTAYAKKYCSNIEFSAEDATRSDPEFLAKVVEAAIKNGATTVNIPDTVGYTTPEEMKALIEYLIETAEGAEDVIFSVHCHNDLGMATSNSLAGVLGGARQIECTVNGLGERAGNTALEEVVMAMRTRPDIFGDITTGIDATQIYRASRTTYNIIGQKAPLNKAIVGQNAFAHESGIHQHGVLANKKTYEILTWDTILPKKNCCAASKSLKCSAIKRKTYRMRIWKPSCFIIHQLLPISKMDTNLTGLLFIPATLQRRPVRSACGKVIRNLRKWLWEMDRSMLPSRRSMRS